MTHYSEDLSIRKIKNNSNIRFLFSLHVPSLRSLLDMDLHLSLLVILHHQDRMPAINNRKE